SGGGEAEMFDFDVNDCNATLSGGSSARISASGVISGELSGGSDLDYCGNAAVGSVQKSGGSTVERRCP
ncbi:MAG: GIN domain-containing protein, partial [Chitinispirillaceae bacterium]